MANAVTILSFILSFVDGSCAEVLSEPEAQASEMRTVLLKRIESRGDNLTKEWDEFE